HIPDGEAFGAAILAAAQQGAAGRIVALGVRPTTPSSAYGYLLPGEPLEGGAFGVARFVEKPAQETAAALIEAGGLWNCGVFLGLARLFIDELKRLAPEVLLAASSALGAARLGGGAGVRRTLFLSRKFSDSPKISFDYAVMERTDRSVVLPVDFAWSDLGSWDAVWAASELDAGGNAVLGDALLSEVSNCLVQSSTGQVIAAAGVSNLAIIAEPEAVLVCDLSLSQEVRALAARASERLERKSARDQLFELANWYRRWLMLSALPVWWALGADHQRGGFFDAIGADGAPLEAPKRSRVQSRQIFVFARAGALAWPGPWRAAIEHGVRHIERRFVRDDGLHRLLVGEDGAPPDDRALLYEQAFALLALAARGPDCADEAGRLALALERRFRHSAGAFAEAAGERFVSNPLMHLFEASLAWLEVGPEPGRWLVIAQEIAEFALNRLIDGETGSIAEVYDSNWRLPKDPTARTIWPGHQFEWAWLLLRWTRLGGGAEALKTASELYEAGRQGVLASGLAANAMDGAFRLVDASARLWPQTERVKAALAMADHAGPE
ncbi:MAG: AGE family epimerase/isomerase, partial [Caulobacteraceae bacterium]